MPPFNHLHPVIVHFPIALLAMAPFIFLVGALWPTQRRGIHAIAMLLLVLGLLGGLLALTTGEAAANLARRTPELRAALNAHEWSAQWTVSIFGILVVAWLINLGMSRFFHRGPSPRLARALFILWLLLSVLGVAALLRTGHLGGHMVHDLHTHGGEAP